MEKMEKDIITEDYVSFETAKVLKEKGFDVVTEKCYILDNSGLCAVTVGQLFNGKPQGKYEIAAPTLQMAMKWLREVHGLHISILVKKHYGQICYFTVVENITTNKEIYTNTNIANCEQAAEAAIKYCLTNLIE